MRTSGIENLFSVHDFETGRKTPIVRFTDPGHFLAELPDARDWIVNHVESVSSMLAMAIDPDSEINPAEDLVFDCVIAVNHLTNLLKALEGLAIVARAQIMEAAENE